MSSSDLTLHQCSPYQPAHLAFLRHVLATPGHDSLSSFSPEYLLPPTPGMVKVLMQNCSCCSILILHGCMCMCQEQLLFPLRFHIIAFIWSTYYESIFLLSAVVHLQVLDTVFEAPGAKVTDRDLQT